MVLKLYGFVFSTNTQRVFQVLKELNIPYEYVAVDLKSGEQKSPEHLARHPFGVVPYIDDDGFGLYESRAICRYLVAKYSPQDQSLAPTELKAQALFEQAASIESSYFAPNASTILVEKVLAPRFGREPNEARYEEAVKKLESALDAYETILAKQKYLAGDDITLADLFHVPAGRIVESVNPEIFPKRPNVNRWWVALSARPSSQAITEALAKGAF